MNRTLLALALVSIAGLAGCDMYFGDGDDTVCNGGGAGGSPSVQYFNPQTGACDVVGGGWEGCDDTCGPCPAYDLALPDLGLCWSSCTGLDEGTCAATAGCYAEYDVNAAGDGSSAYTACWQTPPSGPVQGTCQGLDAQACSRHDNCAVVYDVYYGIDDASVEKKFLECIDEPASGPQYCLDDSACGPGAHCDTSTCNMPPCPDCPNCGACQDVCYGVCVADTPSCASVDCGPGYHCEDQCYPTDGQNGPVMSYCTATCVPDEQSCALIDCGPGYECIESCEVSDQNVSWCSAQCVPTGGGDPGACTGAIACDQAAPACPAGTTAGIANGCYTGYCIPNADCGPHDPGSCGGTVTCNQAPPACPAGTTAGIASGCYTGYCIPNSQCETAACESLTTEDACTSRADCSAVYTGTGCTCTANGCTCETLSFARCESWLL